MKKTWAIVLCAIMLLGTLTGCNKKDGGGNEGDSAQSKTEAQFECGKKTYEELNTASELCIEMMSAVYNAWKFAIYDAEDVSSTKRVAEFADEVGMTADEIKTAYFEMGGSSEILLPYALEDFSTAVHLVQTAYELNGKTKEMDDAIAAAKKELKTMTAEYADYSEYPNLKSYYSEVNSYIEFYKELQCSFNQLKTTIEEYEKNIRTYRSDLEFIFEE